MGVGRNHLLSGRGLIMVFAVFVLLAFAACFIVGCKYTDVLTQHIEDPDIGVLDENADPIYVSDPTAPERPDLDDITLEESDDINEQEAMLPHYDPNAPDNGPTKQRVQSPETPHDEVASEGENADNPDRSGSGNSDDAPEGGKDTKPDNEPATDNDAEGGDGKGNDNDLTSDEQDDNGAPTDAGGQGEQVIIDPGGVVEDTAKGTVAAVGEYATIAQMLGGSGALVAADEAWIANCNARGMFPGELDGVQPVFSGDGTEEGSCDVDYLINTAKPSVVLWDTRTPALTDEEVARIEAAGITMQVVPPIGEYSTQDVATVLAVQTVSSVLSGAGGLQYDPAYVLERYTEFHNSVLKTCYDANQGYSYKVTDEAFDHIYQDDLALSGITDSITTRYTTVFVDNLWKPGLSSATVNRVASLANNSVLEFFNNGAELDVSDGVGLSVTSSANTYMLIDYYLQLSGIVNNAYHLDKPEPIGRPYILMPGRSGAFGTSDSFASRAMGSAMIYNAGTSTVAGNWRQLGDDDFPAILTRDNEIAAAIATSASKANGLYNMGKPYQVLVVPSGPSGSWSQGHVDSFLLAPWAFRIRDAESLQVAGEYAASYYSTFYRCADWTTAVDDWDSAYAAQ